MFRKLTAHVPSHGLWKVLSQYNKVLDSQKPDGQPLGECTGVHTKSMGLPCSHRIVELVRHDHILKSRDLYSHWRYSKSRMPAINGTDDIDVFFQDVDNWDLDVDPDTMNLINT